MLNLKKNNIEFIFIVYQMEKIKTQKKNIKTNSTI